MKGWLTAEPRWPNLAIPVEEVMRAIVNLIIAAMLVVGLAGCTTTKTAATEGNIKCALCNYTAPGAETGGPG